MKAMNWYEFIFSKRTKLRVNRHVLFWLLWWSYFTLTYHYYEQVGQQKIQSGNLNFTLLIKALILVVTHIVACYFFIYFLLPRFLIKAKYIQLAAGMIILMLFLQGFGYFVHSEVFPAIDAEYHDNLFQTNNTIWWAATNSVLLTAPKIIAVAAAIKLLKRWYLKQKEKERVEKEKLITDLQLLKAQIRPGFLFSSLDQIYQHAKTKSPDAPALLIKLSDLLSYLLYECDDHTVKLEKELSMMKEYMTLEKIRNNKLEIEIEIKGSTSNKMISPLLLLPFIENSFHQCNRVPDLPWINLEVTIEHTLLTMKLMNGITIDDAESNTLTNEIINVIKRLELLYPENHELKMYVEQEISVVLLKIHLIEAFDPQPAAFATPSINHQPANQYAGQ